MEQTFIAVLGQRLNDDGAMPRCLQARLDTASFLYYYWRDGQRLDGKTKIIVSGADVACVGKYEAQAMSDYLCSFHSIPLDDIILDPLAQTTLENLQNIKSLVGMSKNELIVVSSAFHMPRVKVLAQGVKFDTEIVFIESPNHLESNPSKHFENFDDFDQINHWPLEKRVAHEKFLIEQITL